MPSPPPAQRPKGKRAMDSFLEEIKRQVSYLQFTAHPVLISNSDQAEREAKYSRHGAYTSLTMSDECLIVVAAHGGRSVTALAGEYRWIYGSTVDLTGAHSL